MLGRAVLHRLSQTPELSAYAFSRKLPHSSAAPETLTHYRQICDLKSTSEIRQLLAAVKPEVIINCLGRRGVPSNAQGAADMILANTWWPHQLAMLAAEANARLIHVSSDGVFSGKNGPYSEDALPDAQDLYGRSKLLGEPTGPHCLTIRTSIVGHDHAESDQLLDWLLRQRGMVNGFQGVVFSGLTTIELARVVAELILPRPELHGVWHVASTAISKHALLALVAAQYKLDVSLTPCPHPTNDRTLDGSRFAAATGYCAPAWQDLISQLHQSHLTNFGAKN